MIDLDGPDSFVVQGDALDVAASWPDGSFQLAYLDPPFNTGKVQERRVLAVARSESMTGRTEPADGRNERAEGPAEPTRDERVGFGGHRYVTTEVSRRSYDDRHADYLGWLEAHLIEARRLLREDGTLYLHLDPREAHYAKVLLDGIFGRECFHNEIIWAYDYGGRKRDRWPEKHDTILVYVRHPGRHHFDSDAVERIPYMAPGLVSPDKRARGKLPTDVWWHTIVPTAGSEKTGYPNQKPEGVLRRIVSASSAPGARVLDLFAGSGTTGAVAADLGRRFALVDRNPEAIAVMRDRLGAVPGLRLVDAVGRSSRRR